MGSESIVIDAAKKSIETVILDDLEEFLEYCGISCRRFVSCGKAGIADLVTKRCIYEGKASLTGNALKHGAGQAIAYRGVLGEWLRPVVVGEIAPRTNEVTPHVRFMGVSVLAWWPMPQDAFTRNLIHLEQISLETYNEATDRWLWKREFAGKKYERPVDCDAADVRRALTACEIIDEVTKEDLEQLRDFKKRDCRLDGMESYFGEW